MQSETRLSDAEFLTRSAAFLIFFFILSILLFFNKGMEGPAIVLMIIIVATVIKPGADLIQEKRSDNVIAGQIGMICALLVILNVVVGLGGVVDSAFVSFLTVPPLFFYLGLRTAAADAKSARIRKYLSYTAIVIYLFTVLMFEYHRIGLPFKNAVLENFKWVNAKSILGSSEYYKTQVWVFILSILIFLWNLPMMRGIRLKVVLDPLIDEEIPQTSVVNADKRT